MTAPNPLPRKNPNQRRWATEQRRVQVYNTTNETIPPFSCVQLVSAAKEGSKTPQDDDGYWAAFAQRGQPVFLITKPDSSASEQDPSRYLFTCESAIRPKSFGSATKDSPIVAAAVCTNGVNHTTVGPKSGQWTLGKGRCWKVLTHDPTRAVYYKRSDGAVVHSLIIEPDVSKPSPDGELRRRQSEFGGILNARNWGGLIRSDQEGNTVPTGGNSIGGSTQIRIPTTGWYDIWFSGLVGAKNDDYTDALWPEDTWPIRLEVVSFPSASRTSDLTVSHPYPTGYEILITLEMIHRDDGHDPNDPNLDTDGRYWLLPLFGRAIARLSEGDVIDLFNPNYFAVVVGRTLSTSQLINASIEAVLIQEDSDDSTALNEADCTNPNYTGEEQEEPADPPTYIPPTTPPGGPGGGDTPPGDIPLDDEPPDPPPPP